MRRRTNGHELTEPSHIKSTVSTIWNSAYPNNTVTSLLKKGRGETAYAAKTNTVL
jgi:hypothetical protein